MLKTIFKYIKFYCDSLFSSKYVVKGNCKACGKCCSQIVFYDEDKIIKTEEQFEQAKKKNRRLTHFEISGIDETDGALTFRCKSLKPDGKCGVYFFRSLFCRMYPFVKPEFIKNNGRTLDGCGYYFDVDKSFKEYLK